MSGTGFNISTYFELFNLLVQESRECSEAGDEVAAHTLRMAALGIQRVAADGRPLRLSAKVREQIAADEGGE